MQALSDEQQMERLEKKVDDGFAEMRAEFRAIRGELGSVRSEFGSVRGELAALTRGMIWAFVALFATVTFGFAGILLQQHL
ncbi:MAG TPA: hypothetical protein VMH33_03970 [Solirubrobacterales bacterium]|nr:hypothetical protein [Solirubrobacterales bacterium]